MRFWRVEGQRSRLSFSEKVGAGFGEGLRRWMGNGRSFVHFAWEHTCLIGVKHSFNRQVGSLVGENAPAGCVRLQMTPVRCLRRLAIW